MQRLAPAETSRQPSTPRSGALRKRERRAPSSAAAPGDRPFHCSQRLSRSARPRRSRAARPAPALRPPAATCAPAAPPRSRRPSLSPSRPPSFSPLSRARSPAPLPAATSQLPRDGERNRAAGSSPGRAGPGVRERSRASTAEPRPGEPAGPPRASRGEGGTGGRQVTAGAERRRRQRQEAAGGPPRDRRSQSPTWERTGGLPPPRTPLYSPLSRQSGGR